jgi:uncharacterized membrane protein
MVAVGLATLGLVLSLLLERLHVQAYLSPNAESFCALGERLDCTTVALSRWSVIGGVPVPLWGAVGFFAIGVAAFRRSAWLLPLTGVAALISATLLVVELASIGALCLLCEAVHVLCFVLFGLALWARRTLTSPLRERDDLVYIFGLPVGVLVALFFFLPPYWGAFGWKPTPTVSPVTSSASASKPPTKSPNPSALPPNTPPASRLASSSPSMK